MDFEKDSYIQVIMPSGHYRYGYVIDTAEQGQHFTVCMHEEGDSKLAFETATGIWSKQALPGHQYGLTDRELRVLALVTNGSSARVIGEQLGLAPSTIRSYVRVLRHKLRVEDRIQLAIVAEAIVKSAKDGENT